jgi:hypothetical protein
VLFRCSSMRAQCYVIGTLRLYFKQSVPTNQPSNKLRGAGFFLLVKKSLAFYGTRRFITSFTGACHIILCCARSFQSIPSIHFFSLHFNIILPSTPIYSKWSLSVMFRHQNSICTSPVLPIRATRSAHVILLYSITRIVFVEGYRSCSSSFCYLAILRPK